MIPKLFEVTAADGTAIYIEYNDANLRVSNITFEVPSGISAQVYLWDNGVLIFDNLYLAGIHSETVPGNYTLEEEIIDGETVLSLPAIAWSYSEIRL